MDESDLNILLNYRIAQAREAIQDAQLLMGANRPARGIINRSYYAMFYITLALLQLAGHKPRKHSGVLSLFDTEFILKGIFPLELSRNFHRAFDLRQASDYQIIEPVSLEEAKSILEAAENFVSTVANYLINTIYPN